MIAGLCRLLGTIWIVLVALLVAYTVVIVVRAGGGLSVWHPIVRALFALPGVWLVLLAKWLKRRASAAPQQ